MCPTMASISKPNSRSKSPPCLSSVSGQQTRSLPSGVGGLTNRTGSGSLTCEVTNGGRKGRENLLPVPNDPEPC